MRIIFLTSKNFAYSNYLLNFLLKQQTLSGDEILVLEQDWILPRTKKSKALKKYLLTSGFYYVCLQAVKKIFFQLAQILALLKGDLDNPYYPYYRQSNFTGQRHSPFNNLKNLDKAEFIKNWQPDLIVSAFSMEIIPADIIQSATWGVVNIHPSLLPKYRGMAPVVRCLLNKDQEIGITLYYIDPGIDTGRIISQERLSTAGFDSDHALTMSCVKIGARQLVDFLQKIKNRQTIETVPNQYDQQYYSLPTRQEIKKFRQQGLVFFRLKDFFSPRRFGW